MACPAQERPASGLQQVANGRASSKVDVSVRAQARVRALCVGDGSLGCDRCWVVTVSCDLVAGGWPCREGEDSLSDAQDRLECIRLDLMNLKQHMAVVAELLPCLEKNPVRFVWPRNALSANVSPHA